MKATKLDGIEALRGYAACAIIVMHASIIHHTTIDLPPWFYLFRINLRHGVPLFFVVSAFSLFYGYFGRLDGAGATRRYFARRFFRIAPLFYAAMAIWSAYLLVVGKQLPSLGAYLLSVMFLVQLTPNTFEGIAPASWSIGVEMLFYVMLPTLFVVIRSTTAAAIAVAVAIFLAHEYAASLEGIVGLKPTVYFMSLISNLPFFMCGALAYFVSERCRGTAREAQLAHGALCLAVGAGGALYILFPWAGAGEMPLSTYAWGGIFGAIVLSQAIRPTFLISNPVTTFLGKISFSLYLVHPITLQISPLGRWIYSLPIGIEAKLALNSAGAIATVVPLAWLTYTAMAPFMKIGQTALSTREILKVERAAACTAQAMPRVKPL